MPQRRISHKSTTSVTCSNNGKSLIAQVVSFTTNQRLIVSFEKFIRMEMTYNSKSNLYMAKQSGLEFVSSGPEIIDVDRIR